MSLNTDDTFDIDDTLNIDDTFDTDDTLNIYATLNTYCQMYSLWIDFHFSELLFSFIRETNFGKHIE